MDPGTYEYDPIGVTDAGATSYSDTSVTDGERFSYQISAPQHRWRRLQSRLFRRIQQRHRPANRSDGPHRIRQWNHQVDLAWTSDSQSNPYFMIYRYDPTSDTYAFLAGTDKTYYSDTYLNPGNLYSYRVAAVNYNVYVGGNYLMSAQTTSLRRDRRADQHRRRRQHHGRRVVLPDAGRRLCGRHARPCRQWIDHRLGRWTYRKAPARERSTILTMIPANTRSPPVPTMDPIPGRSPMMSALAPAAFWSPGIMSPRQRPRTELAATFTHPPAHGVLAWYVDWGDGSTSSSAGSGDPTSTLDTQTFNHNYAATGFEYTVTVSAETDQGLWQQQLSVTAAGELTGDILTEASGGVAGGTGTEIGETNFTDYDASFIGASVYQFYPEDYTITFGDGNSTTADTGWQNWA